VLFSTCYLLLRSTLNPAASLSNTMAIDLFVLDVQPLLAPSVIFRNTGLPLHLLSSLAIYPFHCKSSRKQFGQLCSCGRALLVVWLTCVLVAICSAPSAGLSYNAFPSLITPLLVAIVAVLFYCKPSPSCFVVGSDHLV
jgi:hypothetical protein